MLVTEVLLAAITLIGIYALFNWWKKTNKFYTKAAAIPGPFAFPVVGNLFDAAKANFDSLEIIRLLRQFKGEHGIVRCWAGTDLVVFVSNPNHFETFFNSKALSDRSLDYKVADEWFGEGNVLTADGDRWKKARRIMIQSFHTISQATFVTSMVGEANILVEKLRDHVGGDIFEFLPIMRGNANALIARIAFDESISGRQEVQKVLDYIDELIRISLKKIMSPLHYFKLTFPFTSDGRKYFKLGNELRTVMAGVIEEKKTELKDMVELGVEPPNRYIFNLLQKHGEEPLDDLVTHLIGLFVTGVDTTTATTGFVLLVAAILQDVQQKIYEEDQEVLRISEGRELIPSDLQHYDYLDRVIKETLRLFPVAAMVGRVAKEDVKFGSYVVPEGTNIFVMPLWTRHDEEYFENPMKFEPDRFLPENVEKLHPYAFLPFSTGAKACAGTTFAMMSVKIAVSTIIRNFKVYSDYKTLDDVENNLLWTVTIKDRKNVRIRLEPRN